MVHMVRGWFHRPVRQGLLPELCQGCGKRDLVLFVVPFVGVFCRLCRGERLGG